MSQRTGFFFRNAERWSRAEQHSGSASIAADTTTTKQTNKQTNKQTDRQTDKQNKTKQNNKQTNQNKQTNKQTKNQTKPTNQQTNNSSNTKISIKQCLKQHHPTTTWNINNISISNRRCAGRPRARIAPAPSPPEDSGQQVCNHGSLSWLAVFLLPFVKRQAGSPAQWPVVRHASVCSTEPNCHRRLRPTCDSIYSAGCQAKISPRCWPRRKKGSLASSLAPGNTFSFTRLTKLRIPLSATREDIPMSLTINEAPVLLWFWNQGIPISRARIWIQPHALWFMRICDFNHSCRVWGIRPVRSLEPGKDQLRYQYQTGGTHRQDFSR